MAGGMHSRWLRSLATTAFVLLAAAPSANANLLVPSVLSTTNDVSAFDTASNRSGDTLASWVSYTNGFQVSSRAAGGAWSTPVSLTAPGNRSYYQQTLVADDGTETALWSEFTMTSSGPPMNIPMPGPSTLHTATRAPGGVWSARQQLSAPGINAHGQLAATLTPGGTAVAVWGQTGGLFTATRAADGTWSAPALLTTRWTNFKPQLAVDTAGTVTAVLTDDSDNRVYAATKPLGGAWTTPTSISTGNGFYPSLSATAAGDATVVYNDGLYRIWAIRRSSTSGSWSAPVKISTDGGLNYYRTEVSVDAEGRAVAAWSQAIAGPSYATFVATRAADGTWSPAVNAGAGTSDGVTVGTGPNGTAYLAWGSAAGTQLAKRASAGAAFSAPETIAAYAAFPIVRVDAVGDVIIGTRPGQSATLIALDNAGPMLRDLTAPSTVATGASASFSVSPVDTWSALGATTWDFGDGTTATGTTATHTFAGAGDKTVTLSSEDALGNRTTRTLTVTVTAAPPKPPAPDPVTDDTVTPPPTPPSACTPVTATTVKWTLPKGTKVRRATISVSGQPLRVLKRNARQAELDLTAARGDVRVTVRTRTTKDRLLTDHRRIAVCR